MTRQRRRQPQTIEELLAPDRVWVTPCGCWLWLGGDDGGGDAFGLGAYGRILRPGTRRVMPVHRYVFEKFKGPIPFGYDVDHMCAKAWAPAAPTYVLLVRSCLEGGHVERAQRFFAQSMAAGHAPAPDLFLGMLKVCAARQDTLAQVYEVLHQMHVRGVPVPPAALEAVLVACSKCGDLETATLAWAALNDAA